MIKKIFATFTLLLFVSTVWAFEGQKFTVLAKTDVYEIRSYPTMIVAQTKVDANFENAGGIGFRILADYTFGKNQVPIHMAPHPGLVEIRPIIGASAMPKSEKIDLILPVTMLKTNGGFWVQFIMPEKFSLNNLPRPDDGRIKILQIPARKVAVIQYSGVWSQQKYQEELAILLAALKRDRLHPIGEPIFARYNAPFQLWFLRHNEIWVEVVG